MLKRVDSLFARLLLAQLGLVLVLGVVMGGLFYVERNITVAELYADRWAPQLASAAGLVAETAMPVAVQRRADAPDETRRVALAAPRFTALRRELASRGVPVDDLRLSLGAGEPMVWLHVVPEGRPAAWLGVAGQLVVPEWSRRAIVAFVLVSALIVSIAWAFARRLTRPLERLRARMATHTPGDASAAASSIEPSRAGSPEIAAIAAAYADLLARLDRHERERAVLLAGVSHDLRSPLGRIAMAADLLPDEPELRVRKASIARNVREADRLIESFLDVVRAGELAFDETVDLVAVARKVIAGFERPIDELSLIVPAVPLHWPRANRLMVERLIANLIDNALKHGKPPVQVNLRGDGVHAWIEVVDAGAGIAPEQVERLQDAFMRDDRSRAVPGTGLGLAIVRQVATRLGGSVSFDRAPGRATVRVTVPLA